MTVLVTMQVTVDNWDQFRSACEWMAGLGKPVGMHSSRVLRRDGDPNQVLLLQEWDSHEDFNSFGEKIGDEFNRRAGTEGVEWIDAVWAASDAAGM